MIFIENNHLKVGAKTTGGELATLYCKKNNRELLWQADAKYWGRHSCILFPVIGCVIDGKIHLSGKSYPMKKHGLLRNLEFELLDHSDTSMTFGVASDLVSKQFFPFDYEVRIVYEVLENACEITYQVMTQSDKMPFNIGAHPAFNVPMDPNLKRSDYYIEFEKDEDQTCPIIGEDGLITKEKRVILDHSNKLHLGDQIFDQDALVFSNLNSTYLALVDKDGNGIWTFDFSGHPDLAIWSKNQESPFVCIEPWFGVADPAGLSQLEFAEKQNIQWVRRDELWTCSHRVVV